MEEPYDADAMERRPLLRDQNDVNDSSEHGEASEEILHYSAFTVGQKRGITLLVSLAATFSPLSSFIYYPALHSIAEDIGVSVHMMDLTVTSYMVVSAMAPSILGEMADQIGRRPIFLLMLAVYFVANIGLALQRSYVALFLLRMLQSVGSSGTISSSYAVVADIASPAERGYYVGFFLCGPNMAPSIGPIIGGVLAATIGWRWIFGLLTILSGTCLLVIVFVFPETNRKLVGDGSLPVSGMNKTLVALLFSQHCDDTQRSLPQAKTDFVFPNPLKSLGLVFSRDTAPVLYIHGVFYMTYCCLQVSLSSVVIELYSFSDLQAGLVYVPFGVGCLLASYLSGRLMHHDYVTTAKQHNYKIDHVRGDDLTKFPIEKARFRSMPWLLTVSVLFTSAYGWALQEKLHVSIPLILQFVVGGAMTMIFNISGTLLVDLHPLRPATAQASNNLIRCSMAAIGLAVVQPLIDNVGVAWCYVIFAALTTTALPLCFLEMGSGMKWRLARIETE